MKAFLLLVVVAGACTRPKAAKPVRPETPAARPAAKPQVAEPVLWDQAPTKPDAYDLMA